MNDYKQPGLKVNRMNLFRLETIKETKIVRKHEVMSMNELNFSNYCQFLTKGTTT